MYADIKISKPCVKYLIAILTYCLLLRINGLCHNECCDKDFLSIKISHPQDLVLIHSRRT